jgi:hypothetical protein
MPKIDVTELPHGAANRTDAAGPAICTRSGDHASPRSIPDSAVAIAEGKSFVHPTAVLFNGGVFKAPVLKDRVVDVLNAWLAQDAGAPVKELEGADLDLAVARGAAYYGWVRHGHGIRIRGGTARSYYVGVEPAMPAVPGFEPPVKGCV